MSERKRVDIKAILADPVLREEIVEGATDFICKVEGIRPHSLSPAAQAVDRAIADRIQLLGEIAPSRQVAAAALRAAADQVVPDEPRALRRGMRPGGTGALSPDEDKEDQRAATRRKLLALAAELEGANG